MKTDANEARKTCAGCFITIGSHEPGSYSKGVNHFHNSNCERLFDLHAEALYERALDDAKQRGVLITGGI